MSLMYKNENLLNTNNKSLKNYCTYRYLKSTIGNISLIHRFKKSNDIDNKSAEEKIFDFWMEFFLEAVNEVKHVIRFPVS